MQIIKYYPVINSFHFRFLVFSHVIKLLSFFDKFSQANHFNTYIFFCAVEINSCLLFSGKNFQQNYIFCCMFTENYLF